MLMMCVVEDPRGVLRQGTLMAGERAIMVARAAGVAMLPVEPDVEEQPATGYFFRSWGDGARFGMAGARGCPMLMFTRPQRAHVYWLAGVVLNEGAGEAPHGHLRLVADSRSGSVQGGLGQVQMAKRFEELGPELERGCCVVGGRCSYSVVSDCYLPLVLYGSALGVRVLWSAVSQCEHELDDWLPAR